MRHRVLSMLVAALMLLGAGSGAAFAADDAAAAPSLALPSNEALLKKMKAMERRMQMLEGQLRQQQLQQTGTPDTPPSAPASQPIAQAAPSQAQYPASGDKDIFGFYKSPIQGLKLGAYGELKVGARQNPDADGQWQNGFDGGRLVLLPSYQITDNIIFNSEIEFEHGGTAFDADDKLHGSAEIEQAFIDFRVRDYLNFHSPGIDLVPVGFINLHHEPTEFYSVNRPELANGLVPTTFFVPSWGTVYGRITDNVDYQFQVSGSLEDFGDSFDARTDANTAPAGAFEAGIDGKEALAKARPTVGDFRQLSNTLASTGRLGYLLPFAPGLAGSTSLYYTPNTTPRKSHDESGNSLGHSSLTLLDSELRYRIPKTGWEFRGEYVQVFLGNSANLRANNDGDPTNNVGSTMYGLSGEVAYHVPLGRILGSAWEAVPFYRYTYENLQTGGFRGTDANEPTGAGKLQFHTLGIAVFPSPKLVLKLDYQKVLDDERDGARSDSVLAAVGFFF